MISQTFADGTAARYAACAIVLLLSVSGAAAAEPPNTRPADGAAGAAVANIRRLVPGGPAPALQATRTSQPPTIDGVLSEVEWELAEAATAFIQSEPVEGQPLSERTEVRVLFDNDNLYIGAYCYDSEPLRIIINELKRDFDSREGDAFGVSVDVQHDRRNAFAFFTNPGAAKRDAQSLDDGRYENVNWDGVWHVRSGIQRDGWVAEMMIPFKTLGLRSQALTAMGINFKRRIRRKNEEGYWSPIPRRFSINYVSLAGSISGFGQVSGGRALRVKPFATVDARNDAAGPADKLKIGIDARYRLTTGMALDLTYNTDFSHTEADTQQINLTRFSLFFPEKRDFFLENLDLFSFGDPPGERSSTSRGEDTNLFYTRRIGLSNDGQPLPLTGGLRLSGRAGPWSVGALAIHQDSTRTDRANTFAVARLRRNLFSRSDVGVIFVDREGSRSGDYNRAYGIDLNLRSGTKWAANAFWAQTVSPGATRDRDHIKLSTKWDDGFFTTQMIYADIGERFDPQVGFVPRRGVRNYQVNAGVHPRPRSRFIREIHPHTNVKFFTDRANVLQTRDQHYAVEMLFGDGSRIEISENPQWDRLQQPFEIRRNIVVPAGVYPFREWRVNYNTNRSKLLSGSVNVIHGSFYDGDRVTAIMTASLLIKPRFVTSFSYERNNVDLKAGSFDADLYILRGLYSFNPQLFVDGLVQYNVETDRVFTTVRLNWTYRPLSDFSVVFNENRAPSALVPSPRALAVKLTRLLQF